MLNSVFSGNGMPELAESSVTDNRDIQSSLYREARTALAVNASAPFWRSRDTRKSGSAPDRSPVGQDRAQELKAPPKHPPVRLAPRS